MSMSISETVDRVVEETVDAVFAECEATTPFQLYYVLGDDGEPVKATRDEYVEWLKTQPDTIIKQEYVGSSFVSTVFLALNHAMNGNQRPLLFETMIFGGALNDTQERYTTREEALRGHADWVERAKSKQGLFNRLFGWVFRA